MNGIGRIIEYKAVSGQTNAAQIVSMSEGVIKNGNLHGYGRKINKDGSCGVGFWQVQQAPAPVVRRVGRDAEPPTDIDSKPFGKFAEYSLNG